jgi:ATP-binding cassette subfamily B protein
MMGVERSLGGLPRTFGMNNANYGGKGPPLKVDRERLLRMARYFKPYWRKWLVIFSCIAVTSGLAVLPPLCVRGILDDAIPHQNPRLLYLLVGAIILLNVLTGLVGVLQNYFNVRVGQSLMYDLRSDLFRHLQRMSLPFYTTTRAGEIVSRINNDVTAVQSVATGTLITIVSNVLTVIATTTVIFYMSWQLALLAVLVVPVLVVPTRVVGKLRRNLSQQTQERQADLLVFLQERLNIGGMLLTKIFGQGRADIDTFSEHNRNVMELNIRQSLAGRWLFMCLSVISVTGPALIYLYGGTLAIQRELSVGTVIAFVAYLTNLYRPLAQLANVYVDVQGALAVFERIFEFLDLKPEVEDKADAQELAEARGHIRFDNVSFAYPKPALKPSPDSEPESAPSKNGKSKNGKAKDGKVEADGKASVNEVASIDSPDASLGASPDVAPLAVPLDGSGPIQFSLQNVSFEMLPGERVALVGPSGAGKTTVTYLLPRFLDPDSGSISLDGVDLRDMTQESLRAHIGIVTQETYLFHSTVRENLLYARPDATEEEIIAATTAAYVHEVIQALPEGYDTIVGERAFRLSGGERQRLAIARALLKNPGILILDEATSSLDATSEYLIQQALETLLRGRTSLIIAHRLSTILSADKILVLNRGEIVEMGRHDELLKQGGLYATLYHQQLSRVVEQSVRGIIEDASSKDDDETTEEAPVTVNVRASDYSEPDDD